MADVLERIKKLLALGASDAFEEEARTAARKAAQLIKAHGVELHVRGSAPPYASAGARWAGEQRQRRAPDPPPRPAPPPRAADELERRVIASQYGGHCKVCDKAYEEGARVAWARGKGAIHESCWLRAQERRRGGAA